MISIRSLGKSFDQKTSVLSDISFEIKTAEVVYIMGASGSGKSTLMKAIAGLEDIDKGTIHVLDELISGPSQNLVPGYDHISYVSQDFKLQSYLRVRENIARKIPYLSASEKEDRIIEVLELVGLRHKKDDYPTSLSGGEQQRVCLACHIAHEPEVLLLDEPFSNLDVPLKLDLQQHLYRIIQETETTTLVVSHDPNEALALADKILILDQGEVLQYASPNDIYNNPVSRFAAEFLGPINEVLVRDNATLVRPEKIVIRDDGAFSGVVDQCQYQGRSYKVMIDSALGAPNLIAYGDKKFNPGDKVNFDLTD